MEGMEEMGEEEGRGGSGWVKLDHTLENHVVDARQVSESVQKSHEIVVSNPLAPNPKVIGNLDSMKMLGYVCIICDDTFSRRGLDLRHIQSYCAEI